MPEFYLCAVPGSIIMLLAYRWIILLVLLGLLTLTHVSLPYLDKQVGQRVDWQHAFRMEYLCPFVVSGGKIGGLRGQTVPGNTGVCHVSQLGIIPGPGDVLVQ